MPTVEEMAEREARAADAPTNEELEQVASLVERQRRLERELEELDRKRKAKQEELNQVRLVDLPQAMNEAGCTQFRLADGTTVTIEAGVDAHVSKKNQEAAFRWLEDNGFGDLIKRQGVVDVGRDDALYRRFVGVCAELGVEPEVNRTVHPQTLKAFVREREKEGDVPVPEDVFGVYRYEKAKVEAPKS